MRTLAGRLTTGLACIIAVAALALVAAQLSGRVRMLPVLSGSMTPTYPTGSAAFVTPEPISALRVGQVVVYHIPVLDHHLVMHRVVKIQMAGARPVITTRGDANPVVDPWRARLADRTVWVAQRGPTLGGIRDRGGALAGDAGRCGAAGRSGCGRQTRAA